MTRERSIRKALRRGKTAPSRVRQSTKALAMFWLTPTSQPQPVWPPFCPLDPTEADLAPCISPWGRPDRT